MYSLSIFVDKKNILEINYQQITQTTSVLNLGYSNYIFLMYVQHETLSKSFYF